MRRRGSTSSRPSPDLFTQRRQFFPIRRRQRSSGALPRIDLRLLHPASNGRLREIQIAATGLEFERQLLSTQSEALRYASHLADTLARSEADPARLEYARGLWKELTRFLQQVEGLQRRPARSN
jgi:hypothetical protein